MVINRRKFLQGASALSASFLTGCATTPFGSNTSYLTQILEPQNQSTVFYWIDAILQQIRDQRVVPPRAAYNLAMPMTAGFLAANAITGDYQEPFDIGQGPSNANPEIAYGMAFAAAAAEVFQQPFLIEKSRFLSQFPDGESKSSAISFGKKVAKQVIQMRNDDGAEPSEANYYLGRYERRNDSLKWSPTGPFYSAKPGAAFATFTRGLFPGHGNIKPWTMSSAQQFRSGDFYDPRSPEFAQEFDSIRLLGGATSSERTADQSEIALFWEDGPWGITPPGHFTYIAVKILQHRELEFIELARAFALIGMTQCDASIAAWDNKYHHDIIRPESAIRQRASSFQNSDPRVIPDPSWRSYIPTPEFPAYTSGHSTFAAAGTEMISLLCGTDKIPLSGKSPDLVLWPQLRGVTRHWTTLSQMAEENGMSRLYGGVHWQLDHSEAMQAGRAIAQNAFNSLFNRTV